MKRVIKNQKKMKNAMYIVFGAFALALFAITRMHPSYADNGLVIDDALDAIVLYGEVETATEEENVEEVQDEEEDVPEVDNEGDEDSQDVPDDEEDVDETGNETLTSENTDNEENKQEEKGENSVDEKENEQQSEISNPEIPSIEEAHGVDNNTPENTVVEDRIEGVDNSKTSEYEQSEIGGFIKNPENDILKLEDNETIEIESEEIYGSGEYEGVKVEVYAQTGAFPKGTILSIVPITGDDEMSDIQDVLEEQKNVEKTEKLIAFDITFVDPDTAEELQPLTGTVQVSFNYEENEELKAAEENEEQEVKVYHLNDKDEEGEKIEEIKDVVVEEVVVNEEKSEEENVMVVEAENFSIYAIIKSNLTDMITITYHPNGGAFSGKVIDETVSVQYIRNSSGLYVASGNVQAPNKISENMNVQSGYMFDGWYTTATNQTTEWLGVESDTTSATKTVYAKWLPFNDKVITMDGVTFTIMDRNMGATDFSSGYAYGNEQSNEARAGKYYQWGNNYGFENISSYLTNSGTIQVNASEYGPGKYYSNSTFIKGVKQWDEGWDSSHNTALWGSYSYPLDSDHQGPCPVGYHVPRRDERKKITNLFENWKVTDEGIAYCGSLTNSNDRYCLPAKLGLPFAGYRDYSSSWRNSNKNYIIYWASSFTEPEKAYGFYITSSQIYDPSMTYLYKSYGLSIRCFKDFKQKNLIYETNGGTLQGAPTVTVRWWDYGTVIPTPVRTGYIFLGWYTTPNFEGKPVRTNVFGETEDENSVTLYAKRRAPTENKVVIYDAKGGYFSGGLGSKELLYSEKYISGYYVGSENFHFPNKEFQGKTGYMFDGWCKDINCTTEWLGLTMDDPALQTVYAKWLPFEDYTVTIGGTKFTIMDRNMGAEDSAEGIYSTSSHEDSKRLGKYYQWGNNYGFKNYERPVNSGEDLIENFEHDFNPRGPGNYYYSSKFIKTSRRWDKNDNLNLWGGNYSTNSEEDKQGPCPLGYHVPDIVEWNAVKDLIDLEKLNNSSYCSGDFSDVGNCLSSKLKLPYAGAIEPSNASIYGQGYSSYYWAANPSYSDESNYIYITPTYVSNNNMYYRANGYSLRCFKNSSEIRYNTNGGTTPDGPQKTKNLGGNAIKLGKSIKEGYAFLGWYTTDDFQEGTRVNDNDIFIEGVDVINLYAKWEKTPRYEYNANGGFFNDGLDYKFVKHEFDYTKAYSHTPNLDNLGNKLRDYGNDLNLNEVITLGGAKNLYIKITYGGEGCCDYVAMWTGSHPEYTAYNNYWNPKSILGSDGRLYGGIHTDPENTKEYYVTGDTVTFAYRSDGGSCGNDGYGYYAVISNADVTTDYIYYTDKIIDSPQRTGYTFMGWYETGATEPFDFTGTEVTQDRTLYAKWKSNTYTVTFDADNDNTNPENMTVTYDSQYPELPVVNKTGYTFLGWYNGEEKINSGDVAQITGDVVLKAKRTINQYKIIFDTDGGNEINSIDVDYNSLLTGINLPIPTKECNDFSRWDVELPETMPAHDITLKAIWNYTCSRSSGGGGGAKKSESTTREIAIDTPTEQEHNSANEEQKSEISSNPENTKKQEIGQEIVIDGGTQKTVAVKNTEIVATVRNTTHSSSSRFTKEENDAYSFAKSNGITTTDSIETAKMNTSLTRIQMAKMLSNFAINVLGQEPDPEKGIVKFNDVTNKMDKQYDNAVTKAYQLGIMGQNMKNNEFRPNDEVTRAEFASALSRLLYQTEEGNYKGTGKYYIPHVAKLYNEGIINKTDPKIKEKRGYVMTMLMRTVQ